MVDLHDTNTVNVRASLNNWLRTTLATINLPSYLPSYSFVTYKPEADLPTPSISVFHFDVSHRKKWQGDAGQGATNSAGLMDISAWVSRGDVVGGQIVWAAQLNYLMGMITHAFANKSTIVIQDYLADTSNPSNTNYLIRLDILTPMEVFFPDPNPDIERFRMQLRYDWILRSK